MHYKRLFGLVSCIRQIRSPSVIARPAFPLRHRVTGNTVDYFFVWEQERGGVRFLLEPLDEKSFFVGKYEKSDQIFFDPFYGGNGIESFGFGQNGVQHPRIVLILHAVDDGKIVLQNICFSADTVVENKTLFQ